MCNGGAAFPAIAIQCDHREASAASRCENANIFATSKQGSCSIATEAIRDLACAGCTR